MNARCHAFDSEPCLAPATCTLVVEHPTSGPVFTDRCDRHRHVAAYPIVDVLTVGSDRRPSGPVLSRIPRPLGEPRPNVWRRLWRRWASWVTS